MSFARFQRHLTLALCGMALTTLLARVSSAQQVVYYDFNVPAANPSEILTNGCTAGTNPATSGVFLCLNYGTLTGDTNGFSFVSDSSYTASIDPGEGSTTNNALQFTGLTSDQTSSLWYSVPQNVMGGFTAWYAVKLTYASVGTNPAFSNCCTADGIAFVIQNAAGGQTDSITSTPETGAGLTVLGGGGGAVGYGGIDNSVALEMDTFNDSAWDPNDGLGNDDNHMALQSCGPGIANSPAHTSTSNCLLSLSNGASQVSTLVSNPKSSATGSTVTLADGQPHQVVVIYNGPNESPANYLTVYLDPAFNSGTHTPVAGSVPLFAGSFDITQHINLNNGAAYIGFTAANGFNFEQHELMGFSFTPHSFGPVNVCPSAAPAACGETLPITLTSAAGGTVASVQVVTQGTSGLDFNQANGGNCSGTIPAGGSCTASVTFTPLAPGLRMGAVKLLDSGGNVLATTPIYGIGEGPAIAFGPGTQSTVNTGNFSLAVPNGAVMDAAGDVFIADGGNGIVGGGAQVLKVAPNNAVTSVGSGLAYPQGLAVDGAGDLFIADNNLNEIVEVTPAGVQTTMNYGLTSQLGVAVDGAGNVYVSDFNDAKVIEAPPGCTTSGCTTVVYSAPSGFHPIGLAVGGAGDLYIAVFPNSPPGMIVKIPADCKSSACQTTVGTGFSRPEAVAVDAAGDVFVADELPQIVEVPAGCVNNETCQITISNDLAYGVAVDGKGNILLPDRDGSGDPNFQKVIAINRSQPPSLTFTATNTGTISTAQTIAVQNVGNQTLNAIAPGIAVSANFSDTGSTCTTTLSLIPGQECNLSISFAPTIAGNPLVGSAALTDNALNASPATQTIALSGVGVQAPPTQVAVPNVVEFTQAAARDAITGAGLTVGTVTTGFDSLTPAGSVISQNPAVPNIVNLGSPVNLVISNGEPPAPNPLSLENNYFVTGDYAAAGVTLHGLGQGGMATSTITIPSGTQSGVAVPDGADILEAYLYWTTVENTPAPSGNTGFFRGYAITGQQVGSDQPYTDGALSGTLRVYRADVNAYFADGANGVRFASGTHSVSLPDGGASALPHTQGASLVVIYRVLGVPTIPLKAVVLYDGSAVPTAASGGAISQTVQGFYDAQGGSGTVTNLFAAGGTWNTSTNSQGLAGPNQFTESLAVGNAYAATIVSTPVNNSDNDGILDAWKAGPGDQAHGTNPGYYDAKTGVWVPLQGAVHGQKDLFVQLDWMCGSVTGGICSGENLFPSPDSNGNDPLVMVTQAFANHGIHLHLDIENAISEDTCTDNGSQLCEFPGQPGVVSWKNSLEIAKLWPRNPDSCAGGGDCTPRFAYGRKDSYHYVLFGHSLAIPAWNTRFGTLTGINVSGGVTTITTADRGTGINACPSRLTIAGVLGNPALNGTYNTSSCGSSTSITVATPGVPNWTYPNNTLPEPLIGLTSGTITSISGYSDLGGSDSAVTLGLWLTAPNQDMSKRANVLAGTMFHEIGHTLGLSHGGLYYDTAGSYLPTFEANCKPNYLSSMNYLFQLDGVGPSGAVDYSNQALVTLNETAPVGSLTDTAIPPSPVTYSTSSWYVPYISGTSTASPATLHCDGTPISGAQAYRVNGPISPITPAWAQGQDINYDGQTNTKMRGFNDWGNIDLRQVGATGGEFADLVRLLSFGSSAAPLDVEAGGTVALGSGGTVTLGSGGTVTLGSGGTVTLGSGGTVALGTGGTVTLGSGGTVTLGSGGTVTGAVGVGAGVTVGPGTYVFSAGGTVALGSGGTVTLGSGGTVALGSGGTVTLGSGGTVALGSGGTVTLGSGGTVTLGSGGATLGGGGTVTLGSGGTVALGSGGTVALGSGGTVTLGSGGTVTLGSGGTVTLGSGGAPTSVGPGTYSLGSGGTVTLGSGGTVTLGSGGTVTLGSGGTVTLGSGGTVALGSGGLVALGSGGTVALGSGGTVALGSGGTVTLGSGGATTTELTYDTANSVVRPPTSPSFTPSPTGTPSPFVVVNWNAPAFGVVQTYTIFRSSNGATPIEIGSVSGINGTPPATTFTDSNPDLTSQTVVYTISTTLVQDTGTTTQRQSPPSPPAVLKNDQTIVLGPLPSSVPLPGPQMVTATAISNGMANGQQVTFSAAGPCTVGNQSIASGVSSASVSLTGQGTCTITASQPGLDGNNGYNAADPVSGAFQVLPQGSTTQSQTITFPTLPNVPYASSFTVSATTTATGLSVGFTSLTPTVCTVTGNSGKAAGVGLCKIMASAPGNATYSAASVTQAFTVTPVVLTVKAASPTITYGQPLPSLTSLSAYSITGFVNNDPATVVSGVPLLSTTAIATSNVGTYPITVTTGSLAAANYSFLYVSGTLTIQQASQAILLVKAPPPSAAFKSTFTVTATGGLSGNPVVFTSSGACTNTSSSVGGLATGVYTMTGSTGICSVIANQASTTNYAAAPTITKNVTASGPFLTVSPTSIDFGTVNLGSITTKTITVTNTGTAAATINQPLVSIVRGGNSNEFVAVNLCLLPLAPGKSCTITIAFVAGPFYTAQTATLNVMSNAPTVPPITLTALVVDPLAVFNPTSLNFGTVKHSPTATSTLNVVLSNPGGTALSISSIAISGSGPFMVPTGVCGTSLAAGAKCTIPVTFKPTTTGTFSASLKVVDNALTGNTQNIPLTGKGN